MASRGSDPRDVRMRGFTRRSDVEEARSLVRDRVGPLSPERVPIADSAGRVLAAHVDAERDVPGFVRAMMDGYAVRAEETFGASDFDPVALRILGESRPGRPFDGWIGEGQSVRIMTGAPLPAGADAVVPAENVRQPKGRTDETVEVTSAVPPERHVGRIGEDVTAGDRLLDRGRVLRPQDVGVLASVGLAEVAVVRRPRVSIVTTGDELLPPGSVPSGCRIVDSNSLVLDALVRRDGGTPDRGAIVADGRESIEAALVEAASGADLVLVSGGSSVGAEDHAPLVVADRGELLVHGIAMRPSSPTGIGVVGGRLVFLLPGNPVSCLCAYDFFAGPAIRILGGRSERWPHRRRRAPLASKIASAVGRVDYARVRLVGDQVEPMAISGASILTSTTRADGFVVIPAASEGHPAGAEVEVYLYDEVGGGS